MTVAFIVLTVSVKQPDISTHVMVRNYVKNALIRYDNLVYGWR